MVWALDRILRLARMLWNNRIWSRANPNDSLATIELLTEDTIRLTLRRRLTWTPGQHAYVVLPSVSSLPMEAHPFSIASIPEPRDDGGETDVVFLIRGRTGFTQRLRNYTVNNGMGTVPALLDGPYGHPPDLLPFSTCILIAGPSFSLISMFEFRIQRFYRWLGYFIYPSLAFAPHKVSFSICALHLIPNDTVRENVRGGKSAVRRIVFVWAVKDGGNISFYTFMLNLTLLSLNRASDLDFQGPYGCLVVAAQFGVGRAPCLYHRT